jgi:hypothetical protein
MNLFVRYLTLIRSQQRIALQTNPCGSNPNNALLKEKGSRRRPLRSHGIVPSVHFTSP